MGAPKKTLKKNANSFNSSNVELQDKSDLAASAAAALEAACLFSQSTVRDDGHWCGELKSNVTITAEYVLLFQSIGLQDRLDRDALSRYLFSEQNDDGSWSIAPGYPGNISATVEAYLALKIMGYSPKEPALQKAQYYVKNIGGGVEAVRVFTRIYLAAFGLFPWSAVPELPAELIFMPSWLPINIYKFSSWARSTIVPLLVVCHYQPIFKLPNGASANNDFLDELWINPNKKNIPCHKGMMNMLRESDWFSASFVAIDQGLSILGGLRSRNPLRKQALNSCISWIMEHQEPSGDWAGIFPPMHMGILALHLSGYTLTDSPIRRCLEAIERFAWLDDQGKRIQACVSPVWDTVLMSTALVEARDFCTKAPIDEMASNGIEWVKARQLQGGEGDWRIYRPRLTQGGFSFEYFNAWYPDVDDTGAAIISFLKHDASSVTSPHVTDAVKWVLGMQSMDGGWAAFDTENDKLFLNKIPFSDMDSLCDPSTADIVGRVLEAFGLFIQAAHETHVHGTEPMQSFLEDIRKACTRGIHYLANIQEPNGSWYGRWGVNYIYGTNNVLSGLSYFCFPEEAGDDEMTEDDSNSQNISTLVTSMVRPALKFLLDIQNDDGGWGEPLMSYELPVATTRSGMEFKKTYPAPSTASQTAWALMALSPYVSKYHDAIKAGVRYLTQNQTVTELRCAVLRDSQESEKSEAVAPPGSTGATWPGEKYTGTGFPNHFYIGYLLYSHYFPMKALGRYLEACEREQNNSRSSFLL